MIRVEYVKYRKRNTIIKKVLEWERRKILYPECRIEKKEEWQNWEEAVCLIEGKAQQGSAQTEALKDAVKEGSEQKEVKRIFKILKEVQLAIGVEKINMYKGITVKALLDSGTIVMFIDWKMVTKHKFRLQKLKRPIAVRNIDRIHNSIGAIIHQVEVNVYYKGYVERMRMDIYDLEKTNVILGIPWLQVYNLEINQKIGKVKITRCLPLYRKNIKQKKEKEVKKGRRVVTLEEEKVIRWAIDDKKDWRRKEKIEVDHRKIKKMVP